MPRVPHLSLLGFSHEDVVALYGKFPPKFKLQRVTEKQNTGSLFGADFVASWNQYIRCHLVSQNAARLIKSFLLHTLAATQYDRDTVEEETEDVQNADDDFKPFKLSTHCLQYVLRFDGAEDG